MKDLFRDYGAAIGPTLAFILGLLTLVAKHAFDKRTARRDTERRVSTIAAMLRVSPPPQYDGPPAAFTNVEHVLVNVSNMKDFFDRLAAVKAAMDAADKPVHEHGRPDTIIRFQKMRWHLDAMVNERSFFRKMTAGDDVPLEENFFNVQQSWQGFLAAAEAGEIPLQYRVSKNKRGQDT